MSNGILSGLNGLLAHGGGIVAGFVLRRCSLPDIARFASWFVPLIHLEMINAIIGAPLFANSNHASNAGMVGAATAAPCRTRSGDEEDCRGAIPTSILAVGEPDNIWRQYPRRICVYYRLYWRRFRGVMVVLLGVSTTGSARVGLSALPLIADGKYLQYILVGCAAAFA
ncbi:hypothetical protein MJ699_01775 [Klebsiella pneumoniae]|nr:hypothetical protein MJ699_01775 [Klebsiella pneumoniae]